jgi:hypothetical protein
VYLNAANVMGLTNEKECVVGGRVIYTDMYGYVCMYVNRKKRKEKGSSPPRKRAEVARHAKCHDAIFATEHVIDFSFDLT